MNVVSLANFVRLFALHRLLPLRQKLAKMVLVEPPVMISI
jgi:hypothetical protein